MRKFLVGLVIASLVFVAAGVAVDNVAAAEDTADAPIATVKKDDGRIPGDDIPAKENAWASEIEELKEQEDFENEKIESALLAQAHRLDRVTVTHYCTCSKCCGKDDGIGADGTEVIPYVSVAVDPGVIPLGADVLVDYGDGEIHYYRSTDTGVRGKHIDLCVTSHQEARNLGVRTATVWWVKEN